ncbi:CYTH domain-containing protein [Azospirillum halopraeferens]|uniref:CYTH domain-containing protein n=1 Tax=Azospirillum halopraeferens TaxID=34010 RepID=UPI00041E0FAB|nr:CYTH domain-containing protein [Azospirillum halopraeferens]
MPLEIERRFLVTRDIGHLCTTGQRIIQGYIPTRGDRTVRVRVVGPAAFLTIKGARLGIARRETEWAIPVSVARDMLAHACGPDRIEKIRYRVEHAGFDWDVDVFEGANAGLVIAEVELESPDQPVPLPDWVGREITDERRYGNSWLCRHPLNPAARAA